ncbi:MAG: tetratricopeptide repeat protein [Planctomycetes bacterium]|nr:tetratricopeptide repeat protein [Planctomycetota bacterium]
MRYLLALLLLAGFLPLLPAAEMPADLVRAQVAADDEEADEEAGGVADAEMALDMGRYKTAKLEFKNALKTEPANQVAARGLAETYNQTGDYKLAIRVLEKCLEDSELADAATLDLLGRTRLEVGDFTAVDETVEALNKLDDPVAGLHAWLLKGHTLRLRGLYDDADAAYEEVRKVVLAERTNAMKIEKSLGRQAVIADMWCNAGEAYYWRNRLHEANDCWGNALQADEYHMRTTAWMAQLYLEQNHDSSSHVNYSGFFLKHNENSAVMRLRVAQAHFYRWRGGQGMKELELALKINPDHLETLALRALRYVSTDQYEPGQKDYERALKINPNYVEALGAKALHAATLGMKDVYAEVEQQVLGINPKPARFYEIVADGLSERFRYTEALPRYKKALDCNPRHYTAYRGQGMAAMNYGDDVLGRESLEIALDKDPLRNNLQTVNLLTLLDSYKNFDRIVTDDGRWRLLIHKSESHVMKDLYIEHLQEAWDSLVAKYDFEPRIPVVIESFNIHADFEVRTVGITGLPALGACFGQLVTLDSPSARPPGSYNWASTLRHELDHVWQLQISNGQIPRWLAEGSSVYEEKRTRPEWERHMEDQLFMHYHMDDIPSVRKFNEWFRDGSKILFAYYLGNVMLEYIDKELGGLSNARKMIEMFGQKKTPEEVFKACLNMEPEEFDAGFKGYVRDKRIAHLKMVKRVSPGRTDELYFKYEDGEISKPELVELALAYVQQGARFDAETFLGMAKKRGADKVKGVEGSTYWYCVAMLARNDTDLPREERTKKMTDAIEQAIAYGLEDFQTFIMLAQFAQQARNMTLALHWLKEANRAFPENPQPYAFMYQIYQQTGEQDLAVEMAEKWMSVDENNLQIRLWLIQNVYDPGRNWTKMGDMAEQAIYVAPLDPRTHQYHGFALRKLGKYEEAVRAFEFVRRMASGTPEEALAMEVNALCDIAATWLHAEDFEKCKQALNEAKALDASHPRIKTIEEEMNAGEKEAEEDF